MSGMGTGKEREDIEQPGATARRPKEAKGTKGAVTKMAELYRDERLGEGQPRPWAGEFRAEGEVDQVQAERCWKTGISAICPRI